MLEISHFPSCWCIGRTFIQELQHIVHWLLVGMMPDFALGFCSKPVSIREPLHLPTVLGILWNTGKIQRKVMALRSHLLIGILEGKYNWDFFFSKSRIKHASIIVPLKKITRRKTYLGLLMFMYEYGEIQM